MIGDTQQERDEFMQFHADMLGMTMQDYQAGARETAIYKGINTFDGVVYNALKLSGESGEVADKIGKIYGKGSLPTPENVLDLKKELGDCLWHLTSLTLDLGLTLEEVAETNLEKLRDRQERGVIMGKQDGNILKGDDR